MTATRVIAVVQARMTSTRLPGKVLELIRGRPLVLWTMRVVAAIPSVDAVVAAVTTEPEDDPLVDVLAEAGYAYHRGSVQDVLARCWDAVAPFEPTHVVRATADCPFIDGAVYERQIRYALDGDYDYVGIAGWPVGIAGEVARASALETATHEAVERAEREHVMPFLYARPERFRIGTCPPLTPPPAGRFAVDTAEDLEVIRAIAERLPSDDPPSLEQLGAIIAADPTLAEGNRGVHQRTWHETEE